MLHRNREGEASGDDREAVGTGNFDHKRRRTVFVDGVERKDTQDGSDYYLRVELDASYASVPARVVDLVGIAHIDRKVDVANLFLRLRASMDESSTKEALAMSNESQW